jgi:transposase
MPVTFQTLIRAFLPPPRGIRRLDVSLEDASGRRQRLVTAPTAAWPRGAVSASSVHRRDQRHRTDLAWGTRAVRIHLTVRTCRGRHRACGRRLCTERRPDLGAAYGRHTQRVAAALRASGLALGGKTGARLAARLRLSPSPATRLRLLRGAPIPPTPALQVGGVDAWAWRRGHRSGMMLVDRASPRVVDRLPDRSAASVAAWLARQPTIAVVGRDRSDRYADGIRRGAPEAVQVVARFPLVQNLRQVWEAVRLDHRPALQAAAVGTALARTPCPRMACVPPRY